MVEVMVMMKVAAVLRCPASRVPSGRLRAAGGSSCHHSAAPARPAPARGTGRGGGGTHPAGAGRGGISELQQPGHAGAGPWHTHRPAALQHHHQPRHQGGGGGGGEDRTV